MNVLNFMQAFFSDGSHWHGYDGIPQRVWEHVQYTAAALAIASAIGLPIGLVTGHTGRGGNALAFVSAGARALPTFGLLVLMFVWLGLGIVHDILSEYGVGLQVGRADGLCSVSFTLPTGAATDQQAVPALSVGDEPKAAVWALPRIA